MMWDVGPADLSDKASTLLGLYRVSPDSMVNLFGALDRDGLGLLDAMWACGFDDLQPCAHIGVFRSACFHIACKRPL